MRDYLKCTLSVQLKVALAEQQHVTQIHQAIDMWTAAGDRVNQALASLDQLQTDLNGSWHDVAKTDLADQIKHGRDVLKAWSENISAKPGVLTGLQDLVGWNGGSGLLQTVQIDALEAMRKFQENQKNNNQPLELTPGSGELGKSLKAVAAKYEDVTKYMAKAVSGGDWEHPRRTSDQPDAGAGNTAGTGTTVSNPGGPGAGDAAPATQPQPGPDTPANAENSDPVKAVLTEGPKALDALSGAAQSLQQLLGGSASGLPTAGEFNPADLASMSPTQLGDYLNHLGSAAQSGSGLPTLAGLDSGAAGFGGGATGFGSGIGSLPSALNSGAASGANISAPLAGTSAAAVPAVTGMGTGTMPGMYPPRTAGANAGGGVKPGAAEEVDIARKKGKARGTPGVPLRGRAGKAEPRRGSRAQPSSPAPQRQRDPERVTAELLDEELWQLNPEENEPRYRAGN